MKRVLFICTQNRLRSPTAEQVFSNWPGVETDSAGLGNDADVPLSPEQLAWTDIVFVMEKTHRNRLSAKFRRHLNGKRVICLDIPDDTTTCSPNWSGCWRRRWGLFLDSAGHKGHRGNSIVLTIAFHGTIGVSRVKEHHGQYYSGIRHIFSSRREDVPVIDACSC